MTSNFHVAILLGQEIGRWRGDRMRELWIGLGETACGNPQFLQACQELGAMIWLEQFQCHWQC